MSHLHTKTCTPCQGGIPPLNETETARYLQELSDGWNIIDAHHLECTYTFPDFLSALDYTNAIGHIAEQEGHHPNILLTWGKVTVSIWTHKINGLHENDFILASKCEDVYQNR